MRLDLHHVATANGAIAALAYEPRRPRNLAIVAGHGYSSSKHNLDPLCAFLAAHGCAMYSLDFPGHKLGASGGRLRDADDAVAAVSAVVALARSHGFARVLTLGHSMGAMAALLATASDASLLGSIAIATGYGRPTALSALQRAGATDFRSGYVDGASLPELVEGIDRRYDRALPLLLGRQSLYIAASADAMVSPASVRDLYERAPDEKRFATIESDHTEAGPRARAEVLAWIDERFPRS
ncbi:MAG: alpha/beta fold hydrolase [Candidatus Eremiobacteraeota bacterium]|uniref:AB hydrolase-1 domain-containing protein n=1 Tax=mine drainage metagenome TaxID=410659 RepID=E6PCE4_9ZZZZ|nr:alpha/beta fold hydrolase [Candidatus Eremiobacteraeota bacterium]